MKITEEALILGYQGITQSGEFVSNIDRELVFWHYWDTKRDLHGGLREDSNRIIYQVGIDGLKHGAELDRRRKQTPYKIRKSYSNWLIGVMGA